MWKTRIYRGIFSAHEQRIVAYTMQRLPDWVTPDHMTLLALVGAFSAAAGILATWYSAWFLVMFAVGLVAHWAGDSFDGALARHRDASRPKAGLLIDRGADIVSYFIVALALGFSPYLDIVPAFALLVAVLLNAVYTMLVSATEHKHVVGVGGIGGTEGRVLLIAWVTAVHFLGFANTKSAFFSLSVFDLATLLVLLGILMGLSWQILLRIRHHGSLEMPAVDVAEPSDLQELPVHAAMQAVQNFAVELAKTTPTSQPPSTRRNLAPRGTLESSNRRIRL